MGARRKARGIPLWVLKLREYRGDCVVCGWPMKPRQQGEPLRLHGRAWKRHAGSECMRPRVELHQEYEVAIEVGKRAKPGWAS